MFFEMAEEAGIEPDKDTIKLSSKSSPVLLTPPDIEGLYCFAVSELNFFIGSTHVGESRLFNCPLSFSEA